MRVLITGATGFVGSHLVEALAPEDDTGEMAKATLRVLLRATSDPRYLQGLDVERATGHLGDIRSLQKAVSQVDVVLHLAALTRARNEGEFLEVNGRGTRLLVEAASRSGVKRFVYVSSLAAAGPAHGGRPVEPEDPPHPLTAYGRSKLAGEKVCKEFADDLEVLILRPPAVYGPRDRDLLTFFQLANWGLLPVPTGPVRPLQLIHVCDLVRASIAATQSENARGVYHVAEPNAYPWAEVLGLIARGVGKKGRAFPVPQTLLRMAGEVNGTLGRVLRRPQIFDGDKVRELLAPGWLCETESAQRDLGFTASTPLEKGLAETASWYRERGWLK